MCVLGVDVWFLLKFTAIFLFSKCSSACPARESICLLQELTQAILEGKIRFKILNILDFIQSKLMRKLQPVIPKVEINVIMIPLA